MEMAPLVLSFNCPGKGQRRMDYGGRILTFGAIGPPVLFAVRLLRSKNKKRKLLFQFNCRLIFPVSNSNTALFLHSAFLLLGAFLLSSSAIQFSHALMPSCSTNNCLVSYRQFFLSSFIFLRATIKGRQALARFVWQLDPFFVLREYNTTGSSGDSGTQVYCKKYKAGNRTVSLLDNKY